MKFTIPTSLQLGGMTIEVQHVDKCRDNSIDVDGQARYADGIIEIKKGNETGKFTEQYKQYIFFHELVHHILNSISEEDLRHNEKFVSQFATMLYQAIKTMEEKK